MGVFIIKVDKSLIFICEQTATDVLEPRKTINVHYRLFFKCAGHCYPLRTNLLFIHRPGAGDIIVGQPGPLQPDCAVYP